ncbi:MAG TPA: four helix bundle protein [Fimbriimonas sp.]|nr:four helix bundle protein [Fimbriimonas sp.]
MLPAPEVLNKELDAAVAEPRALYGGKYDYEPNGYKRLRVYERAIDLLVAVYAVSAHFPKSETYGLTQQIRRAAVSIVLNIGEGWGRNSKAELARFCDVSRGSTHEVDAALTVAQRLQFVATEQTEDSFSLVNRTSAMLLRLAKSLRK